MPRRRSRRWCTHAHRSVARVAVAVSILLTGLATTPGTIQAAQTLHVSTSGDDAAAGTYDEPVRTIGRAVAMAQSGDTVEVRGGTYNESVQVHAKAVHIRSTDGEWARLDGSRPLEGFVASGGDWYVANWTTQFEQNSGAMVRPTHAVAAYPDQVFLAGRPLRQVLTRDEVMSGTFFHETEADRIWIADDPAGQTVEASNLSWAIHLNNAHGSSITNMSVRRYATQGRDMAAIRVYSDDVTISGVIAEFNAFSGLSAIGSNIVIRDSRFNDNGFIGVHGDRLDGILIEKSTVRENNRLGFDPWHSAAGIKLTRASNVQIRDNDIDRNDGPGIWTDLSASGVTVEGNLVTGNTRSGIEIELTTDVTVAGNTVVGNGEAGVWVLESQNVNVWHNAVVDNEREIYVLEGPRRDVANVSVRNNIVGRTTDNSEPLFSVGDWTASRSAGQMNVSADYNVYWRHPTSSAADISAWARWPQPVSLHPTVASQIANVGHGTNSIDRTGIGNLPVRRALDYDYRAHSSLGPGAPLTASVAMTLGLSEGDRAPSGPVAITPRLGFDVPSSQTSTEALSSSASPDGHRHTSRFGVIHRWLRHLHR